MNNKFYISLPCWPEWGLVMVKELTNRHTVKGFNELVNRAADALDLSDKIILKLMEWNSSLTALDKDAILHLLAFAEQSEAEYAELRSDAEALLKQTQTLTSEQKRQLEELADAAKRVLTVAQVAKANIYALPGKASYEEYEGKLGQLDLEVIKTMERAIENYKLAYNRFSEFYTSFRPGKEQDIKQKWLEHLFQSWAGSHFILAADYEQAGRQKINAAEKDIDKLIEGMTVWDSAIAHYKRILQITDKAARLGVELDSRFANIAQGGLVQISKNGGELAMAIGLSLPQKAEAQD